MISEVRGSLAASRSANQQIERKEARGDPAEPLEHSGISDDLTLDQYIWGSNPGFVNQEVPFQFNGAEGQLMELQNESSQRSETIQTQILGLKEDQRPLRLIYVKRNHTAQK